MTGIVVALPAEARCLSHEKPPLRRIFSQHNYQIFISGMGAENATAAAIALVEHGVKKLISWGSAGALEHGLSSGDLLIPEQIISDKDQVFHSHDGWREQLTRQLTDSLQVSNQHLCCTDYPVQTSFDKQHLHQQTGASAVDMESLAIAAVAHQSQIPFLALRAIADGADDNLANCAIQCVDEFARPQLPRLLTCLARHPTEMSSLIRLGHNFNKATRTLSRIIKKTGYNLTPADSF